LHQPSRSLDAEDLPIGKAGFRYLCGELRRVVEESSREVVAIRVRVPVLPVDKVTFDDGGKIGIEKRFTKQTVESRRIPRDCCGKENAPDPERAPRFPKGRDPVRPSGQVIERPQEQDTIHGPITDVQLARITNRTAGDRVIRLQARGFACLLDVQGSGIDQVDLVTQLCQPAGVQARTATNVKDHGWRPREVAQDELLRPSELKSPDTRQESLRFAATLIVRDYL